MAAQKGVLTFTARNGRKYSKQFYLNDTAGALATWDQGSGAGANSDNRIPAPDAGWITDIIIAAATGQTQTKVLRMGQATGDTLLNAVQLASVALRPPLAIPYMRGQTIQLEQVA